MALSDMDLWEEQYRAWTDSIGDSYRSYLRTSFYFRDKALRESFEEALQSEGALIKGPFPESAYDFAKGGRAMDIAAEFFADGAESLAPALLDGELYSHQERAIKSVFGEDKNVVVATGTASGKTECFLYPILFELYRQHLNGQIAEPGVRAMIIYPMNALANDQRSRLGEICGDLEDNGSAFKFSFGQYTGQTPYNLRDNRRNPYDKDEEKLPGEIVFRDDMRRTPPHILLTNYSMLEYLLLRPEDSPLFDLGRHWRFIVLDEAHLHRGARGAEMGMLMRRLKRRVREGGREGGFSCVATSATITSHEDDKGRADAAKFAQDLFGENFEGDSVIFGDRGEVDDALSARRYHVFARALEGAFMVHENGEDKISLNRKTEAKDGDGNPAALIEIALCRQCGQNYYVGKEENGFLREARRDFSDDEFGVTYFISSDCVDDAPSHILCRSCSDIRALSEARSCECNADLVVVRCESHKTYADQIKACVVCGYTGFGDPVREIVHGADAPGAVFATALHRLLPEGRRRVLSFADNRQEAAYFAVFAENTYRDIVDRGSIFDALQSAKIEEGGISFDDLHRRLLAVWERNGAMARGTNESLRRRAAGAIWREAVGENRRLSLAGVGLVKWSIDMPRDLDVPESMFGPPWNFSREEALDVIRHLLERMLFNAAVILPNDVPGLSWRDVLGRSAQASYAIDPGPRQRSVDNWAGPGTGAVKFLVDISPGAVVADGTRLLTEIWRAIILRDRRVDDREQILWRAPNKANGCFALNYQRVRVETPLAADTWTCGYCGAVSFVNIRDKCPRWRCAGELVLASVEALKENHYRQLYESANLPFSYVTEEHTAQIELSEAERRQKRFKRGEVNLLSSSTTFEVGVDLGELDAVFLRNVPPEAFNYIQRVGRAGRRTGAPGFALTYCRRNSHDLHYFGDPKARLVEGASRSPLTHVDNVKIATRHMAAVALGAFFKRVGPERFKNVRGLLDNGGDVSLTIELEGFCKERDALRDALIEIVPCEIHDELGLLDGAWIERITGADSTLNQAILAYQQDLEELNEAKQRKVEEEDYRGADAVKKRVDTVLSESVVDFLSRKAVLPKYGFPVDVVELDVLGGGGSGDGSKVVLQRDLSMAIAEYAPGSGVVANKQLWKSAGMRIMAGKEPKVVKYDKGDDGNFRQWNEEDARAPRNRPKYIVPEWGFVTDVAVGSMKPQRKPERLYTARAFFKEFDEGEPFKDWIGAIRVTAAAPGTMVILSEGKEGKLFHICRECGRHEVGRKSSHRTPFGRDCAGRMSKLAYGYELSTDVTRLTFPGVVSGSDGYSLGYALILGAADVLGAPDSDLNMALARDPETGQMAIALYDDVPGGAGLVRRLAGDRSLFIGAMNGAKARMEGGCDCDVSCYGCLRSYRNLFIHHELDRNVALGILRAAIGVG